MKLKEINIIRMTALPLALWALLGAGGCDEGKIYPDDERAAGEGVVVRMKGHISGASAYGTGYSLVLAIFSEGSDFAEISKNVGDGDIDVELTDVLSGECHAELCVINTLRKRVLSLAETPPIKADAGETVIFEIGDVEASPFDVINEKIFATTCLQCHGGTGHSAARLELTREMAYSMLVGVPSAIETGMMRVAPGMPGESTLWEAVATDVSSDWNFNHSNLLEPEKSGFITSWIEKGAEK